MENRVSIVIIGRNEEHSIRGCIGNAIAAAKKIGGAEIIYVDSRSTDNTVSIVESYGIRSVILPDELRLSPSAGRYFGTHIASGKLILFIDADTLVHEDFLLDAIKHFEMDPSLGGCNGRIDDFTEAGHRVLDIEEPCDSETEVKWLRGPCCLYRRDTLIKTGSFDPELAMEEEAELGLRIINSGWRLKKIPIPMAIHTRCYHGDSLRAIFKTFVRDYRANRLGEITRTVSHAFRAGNGLEFCWMRLKTTIQFLIWIALVGIAFMLPAFLYPESVAASAVIIGLLAIAFKKRSIYQALIFVPSKILNMADILLGLHKFRLNDPKMSEHGVAGRDAKSVI